MPTRTGNWEREASVSEEVTEELAYRNFDVVARVADGLEEGDEDLVAMAKAVRRGQGIGKITKFYRNAVSYEPPKQRTDNFYDN